MWAWARTVSWHHSFFSPHYSAFFVTVNLDLFGNFSHQHRPFPLPNEMVLCPKPSLPVIQTSQHHCSILQIPLLTANPFLTHWLLNAPHQRSMPSSSEALRTINFLLLLSAAPPRLFPRDLADGLKNCSNARIQE